MIKYTLFYKLSCLCLFALLSTVTVFAESYIDKADQFKLEDNLAKSNYYYLTTIRNNQDLVRAYYGLAQNQYSIQDYANASSSLNKLLDIDPGNEQAMVLQVDIYAAERNMQELQVAAKKIENIPVKSEQVLRALDIAYTLLGNTEKSIKYGSQFNERIRQQQTPGGSNVRKKSNTGKSGE